MCASSTPPARRWSTNASTPARRRSRPRERPTASVRAPVAAGTVKVPGTTALGIVADASEYARKLRPLSITDSFDFGLGVCGFGHAIAPSTGYWYLKNNHVGSQTGGDQTGAGARRRHPLVPDRGLQRPLPGRARDQGAGQGQARAQDPGQGQRVRRQRQEDGGRGSEARRHGRDDRRAVARRWSRSRAPTTRLRAVRDGAIPSPAIDVCEQLKLGDCPNGHPLKIDGTDQAPITSAATSGRR